MRKVASLLLVAVSLFVTLPLIDVTGSIAPSQATTTVEVVIVSSTLFAALTTQDVFTITVPSYYTTITEMTVTTIVAPATSFSFQGYGGTHGVDYVRAVSIFRFAFAIVLTALVSGQLRGAKLPQVVID